MQDLLAYRRAHIPRRSANSARETAGDLILQTTVLKVSHGMIVMVVSPLRSGADLQSDRAAASRSARSAAQLCQAGIDCCNFFADLRTVCADLAVGPVCGAGSQPLPKRLHALERLDIAELTSALTICSIALDMAGEPSALTRSRLIFERRRTFGATDKPANPHLVSAPWSKFV